MNIRDTRIGKRIRRWKKWIDRYDIGSTAYRLSVLFGLEYSPTFRWVTLPEDEDWWC